MTKIAWVFPGQGSQTVGMGRDVYDASPAARAVFDEADAALGESLSGLCFDGPAERLALTANTQPAILTTSIALLRALEEAGPLPVDVMAGHSLGEYSAHVAAGTLTFSDAVRVVRRRGQFMQEAVPVGTGAMAAVLKAERIFEPRRRQAIEWAGRRLRARQLHNALQHAARIDRMIKGLLPGDVWDEFLQLMLRLRPRA